MKNLLINVSIKVVAIAFMILVVVWCAMVMPLLIMSTVIMVLLCYYDIENNKATFNEFATKFNKWSMDLLVLPYKILGVCDDFGSFVEWFAS